MTCSLRPWSPADFSYLRAHYATTSRREIGRMLGGRSPFAVGEMARKLGIARRHFKMTEEAKATLVRMTKEGYSAHEVATALGTNYRTVREYRKRMGMAGHPRSQRYRSKVRDNTRVQCEREGVESLIELRYLTHRVRAVRLGYPPEVPLSGVAILEAMRSLGGTATRAEILRSLGLVAIETNVLRRLEALGLIIVRRNARPHDGPGPRLHEYRLTGPQVDHRRDGIGRKLFQTKDFPS